MDPPARQNSADHALVFPAKTTLARRWSRDILLTTRDPVPSRVFCEVKFGVDDRFLRGPCDWASALQPSS